MPSPDLLPVFNAQPGATLLLSPEWVIVGASDDYLAATLTERATLVGQHIFDAFPDNPETPEADAVANVRASLAEVMATKAPHDMAPQHYDVPDPAQPGRFVERHWKPRHTPVLDAADQVQFIIQSVQDITASRLAERQLRESRAGEQAARADAAQQRTDFQHFIEQAPVAVAVYHGPQHRIALANATTLAIWGRTLDEVQHRPVFEVLPEAATPEVVALFDRVFATGTPHTAYEQPTTIHRHGRTERVYWNTVFEPQRGPDGHVSGLFTVGTDVTEQVRARQQVQVLNEELAAANEELRATNDEFLASNTALGAAQQQLQQLNQELEVRVQARTRELAQAQAETETQRLRLHQLVAEAPALIASLRGPTHVVELANEGFRAIFGGRDLVGKPYREAIPEFASQPFFDRLDAVYRTGETYYGIDEPVTLDRTNSGQLERTYITYTYQATRDAQGHIDGILVFCYEVTEQVLSRQEREAQRQQLQAVFAQAPVAVCVFRGEDSVLDVVNSPMAEMLGHPLAALVGRPFFEALPELRTQGLPKLLAEVRRTGTPFVAQEQEIQLARHRPGEPGYYNFVYQPLLDAQHQVTGIVCVATDVSAQVAARRVVEERAASFRLMADNAPVMLWVTDPGGYCTYLNQPWYAYTGQTEAAALGLGWTQAVHPDDAAAAGAAFLDANARRVPFEFLYRLRRHDGEYRWAIDRGLPRFGPDGAFEGIVGTVIDVHEQKLAELALRKLTKKLRKSRDQAEALNTELATTNQQLVRTNVDLDNFIYTASHDLKAPISNIEGLLYLLQEELPPKVAQDPEVGPTLTRMLEAVERFKRTIDHLTEVSKLQKAHAADPVIVNLAAIIEDVRQDLGPLLQATGAKLVVDVPALPAIQFSEKNLRSIVYNLLSNAVKYHSPDRSPHIDVRAHVHDGHPVLEVHDNGLGLSPDQLPRLFGMFQRFHDHVEGSGIGLYMVKRMVENAGGRLEVHSQLGVGTTFRVHLPPSLPV
jgi:PAS domain S-box-containing protein